MAPSTSHHAILREILGEAGQIALDRFRKVEAAHKSDGSEVTEADHAAEEAIVSGLRRAFPGTGIISEEGSRETGTGTWYVDPIDGTGAYVQGLAYWGPTVAYVDNGVIEVGALWLPRLREMWFAERGKGAWRDDERLVTGDVPSIQNNDALLVPSRFHRIGRFPWPGKVRAFGSSAAHLALVAGGGPVATVVRHHAPWDIAAGALMIEESGRNIRLLSGESWDILTSVGLPLVAGAPTALRYLIDAARQMNLPGGAGPKASRPTSEPKDT